MLSREADRLRSFFAQPSGWKRYGWRRFDGSVDAERPLELYSVARLVHSFGVARMLGDEQAGTWGAEGMALLLSSFVDRRGGFFDVVAPDGSPVSDRRGAYGHAFALLAGATAVQADLPHGAELLARARDAIDDLFWDEGTGAAVDEVDSQGTPLSDYRGQNANMHLTEAFLACFELTGEVEFLTRARLLAERFVIRGATPREWRVPEHYTSDWEVDEAYGHEKPLDQFRPFGVMPGHGLEWSRLILGIAAHDSSFDRADEAARGLFARAVQDGWDEDNGGLNYTTDFRGEVVGSARMHWVIAEALAAAVWLARTTGDSQYVQWYRRFWEWTNRHVIDRDGGSWWHELGADNRPASRTWPGKPDLYHAYQAVLSARLRRPTGFAAAARHDL
ncbi:N-acyl-D-glucosamine 2-epimerase [Microbacterium aerolatum]|uniref:N-acyl-D-glucosamine 2-epimerase n=2 Tax=Microbacterium aerolatum TaxID=153731 RepID=A0A511AHN6_9MICO|nr:N-acyl-D-glucosamine 2-epimerase [Microbacterium aerolatum]GGB33983.1 N-acyl-D-glucosamine 2-epimerase [Microbacterium aerolatum]